MIKGTENNKVKKIRLDEVALREKDNLITMAKEEEGCELEKYRGHHGQAGRRRVRGNDAIIFYVS